MQESKQIKRILLADDDEDDCDFFREALGETTIKADLSMVHDGVQLMNYLENNDLKNFPDVIFLDLNMPGMDGWDFLEEYQGLPTEFLQKCKLYILSSSIDPSDKSKSLSYECVADFITKPLALQKVQMISDMNPPVAA